MSDFDEIKPSRLVRQKRRDKRLSDVLSGRHKKNKAPESVDKASKHRAQLAELPIRARMRPRYCWHEFSATSTKSILRWLRSQTGKKWDQVQADLYRQIGHRYQEIKSVNLILDYALATIVRIIDGQPMAVKRYGAQGYEALKAGDFYVHPKTKNLEVYTPTSPASTRKSKAKRQREAEKRRRKFSLDRKRPPTYPYCQVCTYEQRLKKGNIYDFSVTKRNDEIKLRGEIIAVEADKSGQMMVLLRHLKGELSPILEDYPEGPNHYLIALSKTDSPYRRYYRDGEYWTNVWRIYDAGELDV